MFTPVEKDLILQCINSAAKIEVNAQGLGATQAMIQLATLHNKVNAEIKAQEPEAPIKAGKPKKVKKK